MTLTVAIVAGAAALGVLIPWVAIRMLIESLKESPAAGSVNYAGKEVVYGLGIVWVVWAGCAIAAGSAVSSMGGYSSLGILVVVGALALVAFAMGLIDDAYGTSAAKGFKGHIKAMVRGRLTTGGLKLLGIGFSSLGAAAFLATDAPWSLGATRFSAGWGARVALAGAAIALTSNLLNLFDLRPGRALKVYSAFAIMGVAVYATGVVAAASTGLTFVAMLTALVLFVLGPVVAVWRYDLTEQGMLGDAGANPMGVVAGALIVSGLPLWGLAVYLLVVFTLNLASERISFSRVIASNAVLSWLDGLGRVPEKTVAKDSAKTSPLSGGNHE